MTNDAEAPGPLASERNMVSGAKTQEEIVMGWKQENAHRRAVMEGKERELQRRWLALEEEERELWAVKEDIEKEEKWVRDFERTLC